MEVGSRVVTEETRVSDSPRILRNSPPSWYLPELLKCPPHRVSKVEVSGGVLDESEESFRHLARREYPTR